MFGTFADFGAGITHWRTSYQLGLQDIFLRYRRSVLGPFWISASLLATVLALAYVFSAVFQQDLPGYIAFLGAGLLAWQLILSLTNEGCQSVMEHAGLLRNVPMPLPVIAARVVVRNFIIFVHNAVAIVAVLIFFGNKPTWLALEALPGVAVILAIGYFLAMVMGPICARFRDVPQAVQSIMQVIFFLTPIFWMPSAVSNRPMFTHANPFYHLIELVRAPLLGHQATLLNWQVALGTLAVVIVMAFISVSIARKRISLWI
ncbi:MAG TPA: ABC transporter permease [Terricaulis sp.]|nr:ABC transporter permease [Terricaulis sp.]